MYYSISIILSYIEVWGVTNSMIKKILVIGAVICFALATFGVSFSHVLLLPLGLGLWAVSNLVD